MPVFATLERLRQNVIVSKLFDASVHKASTECNFSQARLTGALLPLYS